MEEGKTSLWHEAGKAGLILGGISVAYLAVNELLGTLGRPAVLLSILGIALWAGKFWLTVHLLSVLSRRFAEAAGKVRSRIFGFGVAASLCAGLVYGAGYFAYVGYINPEALSAAFASAMQMYSSQLTPDAMSMMENLEASLPSICFFIQLIWCTLLGTIFSAIISSKVCGPDNPFDDDED